MPATKRHPALRPILTAAVLVVALLFVGGLFYASQQAKKKQAAALPPTAQAPPSTPATGEDQPEAPPQTTPDAPASTGEAKDAGAKPETPTEAKPEAPTEHALAEPTGAPPLSALNPRARTYDTDAPTPAPLGGLDPKSPKRALVTFTLAGGGVQSITMANYYESVEDAVKARANPAQAAGHYRLQREAATGNVALISLAARGLEIDDAFVDLYSRNDRWVWKETAPGRFEAEIIAGLDGEEFPVARVVRQYTLEDNSYEIIVEQTVENLTDRDLNFNWIQYGPVDLNEDPSGFRIPSRRIRFGYLFDPARDPSEQIVHADHRLLTEQTLIRDMTKAYVASRKLWPDEEHYKDAGSLVWTAQTSRYFAFAVHPLIAKDVAAANVADPDANRIDKRLDLTGDVYAVLLGQGDDIHTVLELHSEPITLEPGATADLSFGAYAGPMWRKILTSPDHPIYPAIDLEDIVIYQIGWCGWCTFQWIARVLVAILNFFHNYLVHDWALSIILLVLCVRGALHPIFKKSQVSMMRFGKQMQGVQPKIKKLQEKYKNDPQKLKEEQMRLMREEKINYAGALGCLPMLLQSPIWIALYAMLFFAFELRHQPAFFGLFQAISGNHWYFLADLSRPDNLVPFGKTYHIPGLSSLMGTFSGINILPLLWGAVFYVHQKYLTPTTSANMSPEQEQTQKIMKVMMVVMMPVFMYNAPSGLLLYFLTNSALAIAEGRYIRSHVEKLDLEPTAAKHEIGRKKVSNTAKAANPFSKKSRRDERDRFKKR